MGGKDTEACGRCTMTSVVGMNDGEGESPDPFEGDHIEVSDSELRVAAYPAVVLGRVKHRLDEVATRLTYGR